MAAILLVEDDPMISRLLGLRLSMQGHVVATAENGRLGMDKALAGAYDLVLMDMHMPEMDGHEAVRRLREQGYAGKIVAVTASAMSQDSQKAIAAGCDDYIGKPVGEDFEQRVAGLLGGDDFLTKPIEDRHLATAVAIRARRAREFRALMSQDSLTGLLTHARFKERLAAELARGQHARSPLVMVLIDIDHFKLINDEHGHLAGDRVLKTLANLLRRRIRRSDVAARYGGEEFAVIFHDCGERDAVRMLDGIRLDFSTLQHGGRVGGFRVTLSAGVAMAGPDTKAERLIEQADEHLYQAKRAGRNQVVSGAGQDEFESGPG